MGPIQWRTERRRLSDMVEWDRNPRELTEKQAAHLKDSLKKFGYVEEIVLNADGQMIGGHQRRRVMLAAALADPDAEVDVRLPDRQLTPKEAEELAIRLNANTGRWDFDLLANEFDVDLLADWGLDAVDTFVQPFDPNLDPEIGSYAVTDEDVDRAGAKLDGRFSGEQEMLDVICPDCGHEFHITGK